MKVTTLRLTERLWTLLEAQAQTEGTSASQLIREGAMMRLGYALGKQGREELTPSRQPALGTAEPFGDFDSAAGGVLDFLHERLGFSLWLITRVEDGEWVVEHARDEGYGVEVGDAFRFADTYCAQMVEGLGPRFAPETSSIPCYATAGLGRELPIGAYVGVPLLRSDSSLFGTLCAIDPAPQPPGVCAELPVVELSARLLSSLLEKDAEQRRN